VEYSFWLDKSGAFLAFRPSLIGLIYIESVMLLDKFRTEEARENLTLGFKEFEPIHSLIPIILRMTEGPFMYIYVCRPNVKHTKRTHRKAAGISYSMHKYLNDSITRRSEYSEMLKFIFM